MRLPNPLLRRYRMRFLLLFCGSIGVLISELQGAAVLSSYPRSVAGSSLDTILWMSIASLAISVVSLGGFFLTCTLLYRTRPLDGTNHSIRRIRLRKHGMRLTRFDESGPLRRRRRTSRRE